MGRRRNTADSFWAKVNKRGPDECWPWNGSSNQDGYGLAWLDGRCIAAHRLAFFLTHGRWPEPCGLHSCDNPPCCNPAHVFEGTKAENNADKTTKGRQKSGGRKLSAEAVKAILELRGKMSQTAIGARFGVTRQTVSNVFTGRAWGRTGCQ